MAKCNTCLKTWTIEDIVSLYAKKVLNVNTPEENDNSPVTKSRLKALCIQHQQRTTPDSESDTEKFPDLLYNIHHHMAACFKHKRKNEDNCDCWYRL